MSSFREEIFSYIDEYEKDMKIVDNDDYRLARTNLTTKINDLEEYLKNHHDKDKIINMVDDILSANNITTYIYRCHDFDISFLLGLKIGAKMNSDQYSKVTKKIELLLKKYTK